ncbi:glycoside hydrolase, partial [Cantharellus anzutake]|uniref:glycoside hydrolase n=1 Tax=Cantharellus anzutake TaxID=1750568 RepID=UPI00190761A2
MLPTTSRVFLGAIALFSSFQAVSAHGGVLQVTIDGQSYKGALPGGPPMDTMIRQVSQNGPVTDPTSMDMSCGYSTGPAPEVAPAKPGSNLKILWANSYTAHWIHFMGPIMTYMALCENNDCKTDKGTSNKWFKISELGQKSPGGDWYMKDLFNGEPYSVQIPTGLPDGQYLLRSELIALHRAQSSGGAEFYPSCMQLSISGGKASTSALSTVPTTMFPGAYKASDPGILVDVYQAGFNYAGKFPGPPLVSLLG